MPLKTLEVVTFFRGRISELIGLRGLISLLLLKSSIAVSMKIIFKLKRISRSFLMLVKKSDNWQKFDVLH